MHSNKDYTVVLLRGDWGSLDLYMRGIVWMLMVILGEGNGQKVLVEQWIFQGSGIG